MRSPITETIKRVQGMVDYVRENLDDGEYDLFLDLLVPEPEPAKPKRGRKKKSARAQSLSSAIQRTPKVDIDPKCSICGNIKDHSDHDTEHYLGAHKFESGKSTALRARRKSSTNGVETFTTVCSEVAMVATGAVTGGSSET